jgi:hypothetical protein
VVLSRAFAPNAAGFRVRNKCVAATVERAAEKGFLYSLAPWTCWKT